MTPGLVVTLAALPVLLWGLYVIYPAVDRLRWQVAWLIGENGRMRTALRAAGITVDDPALMPERTTWLRGRWNALRRRRAVVEGDTDVIPVVVHDLPRRRPRPGPADDVDEQLERFTFEGGRA